MVNTVYASLRLINGLVTIFLAFPLHSIFTQTRKNFYRYWSLGFVTYGISILMRIGVIGNDEISLIAYISYPLLLVGLFLIIAGIGDLVGRARQFLASLMILPVVLGTVILSGREWLDLGVIVAILPYLFITISLLYLKMRYNSDILLLLTGWSNVLLLNFAYMFQLMDEGYVDFMMTFTKLIIYIGMTSPSFSFLYEDLTSFLIGGIPDEYPESQKGQFSLVNLQTVNRGLEITWVRNRIKNNSTQGIRTIFVSLYDQIVPSDLFNGSNQEDLYFVRMVFGHGRNVSTFKEHVISINDDLNLLEILFGDIFSFSSTNYVPCEIIVYSLSQLIHTHGYRRFYSFLTSKMSQVKTNNVSLTGFYTPDAHENQSVISMLESLADRIIN